MSTSSWSVALEQTSLRERHHAIARDNEVIERADVDQRERLLERLRQQFVRARRLGDAGRMVVRKDHRGGVAFERGLHNFARINRSLCERAAKHFVGRDQPMLAVEKEDHEDFVSPRALPMVRLDVAAIFA